MMSASLTAFLGDIARCLIGLLLLAAATGKLRNYRAFRDNLSASFGVPAAGAALAAPALVALEALLAAWLLARGGSLPMLLSLLLLTGLSVVLAYRYFTQSVVRCSCFGEAQRPVSQHDLILNALVIAVNALYFALPAAAMLPWQTTLLACGLAAIACVAAIHFHEIATLARSG